ncbi:hypothetical protein GDO78_015980 [Eleutherodactylus coqui]|uniref:Uncharacterized protein n=1 Tax=Eleutherodactylus coqui TaxID=57060 RepID=A0A8J6ED17_ELECQ|nr:hypothetical protein GDO78_015980 [Eleutherodactylus coqui]
MIFFFSHRGTCSTTTFISRFTPKDGRDGDERKDIRRHLGDHLPADRRGVHSHEKDSDSHHPSSFPDPEASRTHQQDDGAADRRGSYKVSGCGRLFLHGGVGVYTGPAGCVRGRHAGGTPARGVTRI